MTKSLVLGAGGQIGSDLVPALLARGEEVWMLDLRPPEETAGGARLAARLAEHRARERWVVDDATGPSVAELIARLRPDRIFHLVALLSATGEKEPLRCWEVNLSSLTVVLEALAALGGRRRLLWPSSIAAFGPLPAKSPVPDKVPNEYPLLPTTMYGVTKVAGELLGAWYARQREVDFRSLRFPGLLSAVPPGGGSSDYANLLYFAAARGAKAVEIFVRADTRIPFQHMDDALAALLALADADEVRLTRRAYNVTSFAPSAKEIADSLRRAGCPLDVTYRPDHRQAFVDSWPRDLDDGPARRDWGWTPRLDLDATTARLLDEIRALDAGAATSPAPVPRSSGARRGR